ncbi:hypothetical protein [Actinacidiphila sp. bgisy144]|uniref:hypothetical protein n=1 Tax=unclassified Actinacidiphila TaxID=2995708 RepID=UPI003EB89EE9
MSALVPPPAAVPPSDPTAPPGAGVSGVRHEPPWSGGPGGTPSRHLLVLAGRGFRRFLERGAPPDTSPPDGPRGDAAPLN